MNTDHDEQREESLARDASRLVRQGAEELDAATLARLHSIREKVIDVLDDPAGSGWMRGWRPAAGIAAALMFAMALWMNLEPAGREPPEPWSAKAVSEAEELEIELMLVEENVEMIEELEFYAWLETTMDDGRSATEAQPNG